MKKKHISIKKLFRLVIINFDLIFDDGLHSHNANLNLINKSMERWPSGLRRTLGKRVKGQLFRGFESHSLRHLFYAKH